MTHSAALNQFDAGEQQRQTRPVPTSATATASEQAAADAFAGVGAPPRPATVSAFWPDALNGDPARALAAAAEPAS